LRKEQATSRVADQDLQKVTIATPLLHVCGSLDPWFNDQTQVVERNYQQLGGEIKVIVREGGGHYPTAPSDTKPVVEFIIRSQR